MEDKLENLVSIDDLEAIDEKLGTYAKEEDVKKIKDKLDNFVTIDDLQAVEEVVDKKLSKISLKEGKP